MFLLLIATSPVLVVMEACIMREFARVQDKRAKVHVQTLFQKKGCRGVYSWFDKNNYF